MNPELLSRRCGVAATAARACRPGALAVVMLAVVVAAMTAGCGSNAGSAGTAGGRILAVGAENEYANVIAQVGGRYVNTIAIESNPNTDPHTFEASASVAAVMAGAQLIVQNGLGYDTFMERIESASPSSQRKVIDVQKLLGLPDSTANPHLWYRPQTMPAVAKAIATDLSALQPKHAAYFQANVAHFERSLTPWYQALERLAVEYPNTPVASTEPVGDYMLEAAGTVNLTPFALQADIMNGVDPAPQDVTLQDGLFAEHRVKVLLYNQQVTDSVTQSFLEAAKSDRVPVVGVYETMPTPGYDYQSWMLAEVRALRRAIAEKVSTQKL
ncbi:MAG TPA: zinc ABC transporter substrate-binding protein [Solirubrobacteraceae bacterium]|nr:zinc ABC transporter substrate-binding protein [Solirubrobacteraceae bacterium]